MTESDRSAEQERLSDDVNTFPSDTILDSRRLTGPNLFAAQPGAVLEVLPAAATPARVQAWQQAVHRLREQLAWPAHTIVTRIRAHSAQLFISAPLDGLLTATLLNELAWLMALAHAGESAEDARVAERIAALHRDLLAQEVEERDTLGRAALLCAQARVLGRQFLLDDELVTVGTGTGGVSWPVSATPAVSNVEWPAVHDVPIALVTGSNGKTTTTRLLAAMWRQTGQCVGWSCSDGVMVASGAQVHALEHGDFTGPGGARTVLRDRRVQVAVLETARGGLLRRGLAVTRADVAVITNISADHFGEYGVTSLRDLAQAKALVASVLDGPRRTLVLNALDAELVQLAVPDGVRVAWFAVATSSADGLSGDVDDALASVTDVWTQALARVHAGVTASGVGAFVRGERLHLAVDGTWHDLGPVAGFPCTLNGSARHNVQNLAAAAVAAGAMGAPLLAIEQALQQFGNQPEDNPGRLTQHSVGGVSVLIDYAHNPDGMIALCATAAALPASRRLLLVGQAGNREDDEVRALAHASWSALAFDHVIIKEIPEMLRGRALGAVSALLHDSLLAAGAPAERLQFAPNEFDGVRDALTWSRPGDVLVLGIHAERERVLRLLEQLKECGWRAGDALPVDAGESPPISNDDP